MICNLRLKMNSAIILAGGQGKRTNLKTPKQFVKIDEEKYIINYSFNSFNKNEKFYNREIKTLKQHYNIFKFKYTQTLVKSYLN